MASKSLNRRTFVSLSMATALAPLAEASAAASPAPAFEAIPAAPAPSHEGHVIDFTRNLPATGTLPVKWICGSPSAMDNTDPPVQVHWYNAHTAVLRQNRAYAYEAPFMMLYFGNERILMIDQGDTTLRNQWPLREVVDECIASWCAKNGRKSEQMELLLAISHLHMDHFSAQNQFNGRPNTRIMGLSHAEMIGFWGMRNYPADQVTLDLGGRQLWIWGSPGHTFSEFAYYDTYTQILFSGDMFYRGRLYITIWDAWLNSMKRLVAFCAEHPVTHLAGCHVEMGTHGEDYPTGNTYQPNEAPWMLTPAELKHTYEFALSIDKPGEYFAGPAFVCRLDGPFHTPDTNPYLYT
ncbi:MAG: MBL fold metallo-hydrolase [Janthinobacterium lividum]